jgi:hypothetical protein
MLQTIKKTKNKHKCLIEEYNNGELKSTFVRYRASRKKGGNGDNKQDM